MSRTVSVTTLFLSVSGLILGSYMTGVFGPTVEDDSGGISVFVGFVVVLVSAALLLLTTVKNLPKKMTPREGLAWEEIRSKGKWLYAWRRTLRDFPLFLIGVVVVIVLGRWQSSLPMSEVIRNCLILLGIVSVCEFFVWLSFWNYYEREYAGADSGTPPNPDSNPTKI